MNGWQRPLLALLVGAVALAGCDRTPQPPVSPAAKAAAAQASAAAPPEPDPAPTPAPKPGISPSPDQAAPEALAGLTYPPQDECAARPGWPAFRKSLGNAIRARDADSLAALAAPDIMLDYGGGSGIAELKRRLADPAGGLWQELAAILPLGCAVEGGLAAMPWVFWNVPETVDSYHAMLVLGDATPLRQTPGGKVISPVGWFLVGIDPMAFDRTKPETQVTLDNGRKGWIETARLRSLLDYRLIAEPADGTWRITAFIAGD
ncbi:MAG: hypothetical protein ACK40C_03975 [Novosphingobium meiothermophilum]